jgi:hypothetical protein
MTARGGSTRTRVALSMAIVSLSAVVFVAADRHGRSSRVESGRAVTLEVARPEQAYAAWKESGVRGRTLLLFASFPHLWARVGPGSRGSESFITRAALDNVFRRIVVLVPDDAWDEFYGGDAPGFFGRAPPPERSVHLHNVLGFPVLATTPSSLPGMSERPLVYVDRGRFDPAWVQELLLRKGIASDLLVVSTGR